MKKQVTKRVWTVQTFGQTRYVRYGVPSAFMTLGRVQKFSRTNRWESTLWGEGDDRVIGEFRTMREAVSAIVEKSEGRMS